MCVYDMVVVLHEFVILSRILIVQHLMRDFNDSVMKTANIINITLWHEVLGIANDNIQQKVCTIRVQYVCCYPV
jgi:hypothetical protein